MRDPRKGLQWKSRTRRGGEELQRKARPGGGSWREHSERQLPPIGYAQNGICNTANYLLIFALLQLGLTGFDSKING